MRNLIVDPGILVEFDEGQDALFIQRVQARIVEVIDEGGVSLQGVARIGGAEGGQWAEWRTYNLSGAHYWHLVSGLPVRDPEHARLLLAKVRMAKGFGGAMADG